MNDRTRRFEAATLIHMDAAYNLARWLLHDSQNAHDVVQEAYLRAFRFFDGLRGENAKPWLLQIVRNECYTWMRRDGKLDIEFRDDLDAVEAESVESTGIASNPEALMQGKQESQLVNACIGQLPPQFREVLILRELEDMPYQDIARVVGIPAGTVMSRLSRGRAMLKKMLEVNVKEMSHERA